MRKFAVLLAVFVLGCGSDGASNTGDDTPIDAPNNTMPDAAPIPPGYTRLVGRTWSLPSGATDTYRCVRITIPSDMYLTDIVAQAPAGTHHTVLSIAGANGTGGADGEQNCSVGTLGTVMLYASGVGTDPLNFPAGVGLKIPAGTQIHLNLHLFNATDNVLTGDSAILVKTTPTPPAMLAEMVFAGKILFGLPASSNPQPIEVSGGCTVTTPYTLFAVWPHMHKLAHHQKLELTHNAVTTVLHDAAFTFTEQHYYPQSPMIQVAAGDTIKTTCTFLNDTGALVTVGDSTLNEMCFTGLYRYPAANAGLFQCTDRPQGF